MSVRTDKIISYEETGTDPMEMRIVDRIIRMKTSISNALNAKGISDSFFKSYMTAIEEKPGVDDIILGWLKEFNQIQLETEKVDALSLRQKHIDLHEKFLEVDGIYDLNGLLRFLFKADWLLIFSMLDNEFTYVDVIR